MSFSIRQKLFVLLAGLAALVIAGVLSSVSSKLGEAILSKVEHDFKQSDVAFKRERKLQAEKLLESATLFGESTSFKANVKLNDTASVYATICRATYWPICSSSPTTKAAFCPGGEIQTGTERT